MTSFADNVVPFPTRVTPTVSQDVRVDFGSWLAQLASYEEPILKAVAAEGLHLGLATVPMGAMIEHFIGPMLCDQYLHMALVALEGAVKPLSFSVPAGTVFATAANLINANEPALAAFLGDKLEPMLKAALGKLLPGVTLP